MEISEYVFQDDSGDTYVLPTAVQMLIGEEYPYSEVSDADISAQIACENFVDVSDKNPHYGSHTSLNEHVIRIASLVRLIEKGVKLDPIELYFVRTREGRLAVEIVDGFHRTRACMYCNTPILICGNYIDF